LAERRQAPMVPSTVLKVSAPAARRGDHIEIPATYGRLVTAAYPSSWPREEGIFAAALKKVRMAFEAIGHALSSHEARVEQTSILETAARLVDERQLRVVLDRVYPLAEAGEAQRVLEVGEITGRFALKIPH